MEPTESTPNNKVLCLYEQLIHVCPIVVSMFVLCLICGCLIEIMVVLVRKYPNGCLMFDLWLSQLLSFVFMGI